MRKRWTWAFGKISQAVEILATDPHDARHRVWRAADYFLSVMPEDLPTNCYSDFEDIRKRLLRCPPSGHYKSAIEATFARTRNTTASKIAADMLRVYTKFQLAFEADKQRPD